jgi:putative ABC transport system permease protein
MGTLVQDIRYSIRMLARSPGFTAIAVLTLALGIGANTAIFSVINAVLIRPLPFHEPGRLVELFETEAAPGRYPFAGPDYLDWQAQNHTLEATSLYTWGRNYSASGSGEPEGAEVISTQANFFSVLGVQPKMGRTFSTDEGQPGKTHVAILSYGFWQRHFGGDLSAMGKSVVLDSESYTVIGVMPNWFNYPQDTDLWTPFEMSAKSLGQRGSHSYRALGRLKPGVTATQAQADLTAVAKRLEEQYPDSNEKVGAAVVPMKEQITGSSSEQLMILLGAVALVLLVACANVANLLLARATGRQREIAVRSALGAGRWRVARQMLTESLILSLAGATLGILVAKWCVTFLQSVKTLPIPRVNAVQVDLTVLLFAVAVAVFVGILFGLAPALHASQLDLTEELKSSALSVAGPSGWRRWTRDALVAGEIAMSLALLVGAGLLLRSFARLRNSDIGVQSKNVLTVRISLPEKGYATLEARRAFFDQLVDRVQHIPGVEAGSVATEIPLEGGSNSYFTVEGRDDPALKNTLVEHDYVTPEYFRTFGIPILEGRTFSAEDLDHTAEVNLKLNELFSSPKPPKEAPPGIDWVAVINRSMAQLAWPNENPIGKVFKSGGWLPVKVIGVVGDVKPWGIRQGMMPEAYYPLTGALDQSFWRWSLVVKTSVPPMSVLSAIRREVGALDSNLAVSRPRKMDDVIADSMQDTTVQTFLLGVFATLAVALAALGIYGIMAYLVAQRTHEIGIRLALGAQPSDVLRLVMRHGIKLTAAGVGVGVAAALGLTRLLSHLLFDVTATDPLTFMIVAILLSVVALLACYIPARRAMGVDPMVALRYE